MSPFPNSTVETAGAPVVPDTALVAARAADDKLGEATVVLAMGELLGVVDAFVVTSGRNDRQVRALVEEVERKVKDHDGTAPVAVEGLSDATWVLMDYGDFIVHVFAEQTRSYYDLEHLWSGAPRITWQDAARATIAAN
jgi:ribosome-associated protein